MRKPVLTSILCLAVLCLTLSACSVPAVNPRNELVNLEGSGVAGELYVYVDSLMRTPHYSVTYTSDKEYYLTAYNTSGECVAEYADDRLSVYLTNGTGVHITNGIVVRPDVDNLVYVKTALRWVIEGKADFITASDDGQHLIIIESRDAAYDFYCELLGGDEAGDVFDNVPGQDVSLLFAFVPDPNGDVWFIDYAIELDSVVNSMWVIVDKTPMDDWNFGEYDWYEYNFEDPDINTKMVAVLRDNIVASLIVDMLP